MCLTLVISGCTFTLNIDTDYAAQRDGDGRIEEEVTTSTSAKTDPTLDTSIEVPGGML